MKIINLSKKTIFIILLTLFDIHSFLLRKIEITQILADYSFVFEESFASSPQIAAAMEEVNLQTDQFGIQLDIVSSTSSLVELKFDIFLPPGGSSLNLVLNVGVLFSDESGIEVNIVLLNINEIFSQINFLTPKNNIHPNSFKIVTFPLFAPSNNLISQQNETSFKINNTKFPQNIALTEYCFSYLVITLQHICSNILVTYSGINKQTPNYIMKYDNNQITQPTTETTLLGIQSIVSAGNAIKVQKNEIFDYYIEYQFSFAVKIGYSDLEISSISSIFIFYQNTNYICGQESSIYVYQQAYESLPLQCQACHISCSTCIVSLEDPSFTNENFCTSCPSQRYMQTYSNTTYGQCICSSGLGEDDSYTCITCTFNCLQFTANFIKSQVLPKFILVFSFSSVTMQGTLYDNLKIYINNSQISYQIQQQKNQATSILTVDSSLMQACEQECQVYFLFQKPYTIRSMENKFLSKYQEKLYVRNYFSLENQLPDELNQAFLITSLIMGVAAASGQTSLIKMLFEIEQIIQFHKYLNIQIPIVFKQFIEALSSFQFLDLTFFIPDSFLNKVQNLSGSHLDSKGPIKAIFYENGVNYYKNILPVLLSCIIIILANLVLILLFTCMPCLIFQRIGHKIRLRISITLSDLIESIILPSVLFSTFNASYMVYSGLWMHIVDKMVIFCLFIIPALVVIKKYKQWRNCNDKQRVILKQILQDFFQDCKVESKLAVILYFTVLVRKLLLGLMLNQQITGIVQIVSILLINISQIFLIVYMVLHSLHTNKIKVITRSINLISIIGIECIILVYNMTEFSQETMILLGITCTYLTIIVTVVGIADIFVKIFEVLLQKVHKIDNTSVFTNDSTNFNTNDNSRINDKHSKKKIKCKINNPQQFYQNKNKISQENIEEEDRKKKQQLILVNKQKEPNLIFQEDHNEETYSDNSQIIPLNSQDSFFNLKESVQARTNVTRNSFQTQQFSPSTPSISRRRNSPLKKNSLSLNKRERRRRRQEESVVQRREQEKSVVHRREKVKRDRYRIKQEEMSEIVDIEDD